MIPPRRRKSCTTLLAMAFNHWFLIGSDSRMTDPAYGRVLDNSLIKFHPIYDNVFVCWSGNGELFDELKKISPHDVVAESKVPETVAQAAKVMVDWVNHNTKKNNVIVELIVVGGIGAENYRAFHIRQDPKTANSKTNSWKHEKKEVKTKIVAAGSGGSYAFKLLKEKKVEMENNKRNVGQMEQDESVKLAFDALHTAVLKDWASGGTLRVYYQARNNPILMHTKDPIIPEYSLGGYHPINSTH